MTWVDQLFRRRRINDDFAAEIEAHLEEKVDNLVAQGMSRGDAVLAARRAFGNVTRVQEDGRETWQWPTLESFLMDIRFALRQLRRTPAFTAIVVLTLAIGIASTATVFSWTRAILLDPLPGAADANRIFALESTTPSGSWTPVSWLDFRDFRADLKSFDGLAASYPTSLSIGDETQTARRRGELVSSNFFDVLRVSPTLGRFFPRDNDIAKGAQPVVVIGYGLWQSRWHGDSAVIGSVVRVNRFPFTVIGVAPPTFHGSMPGEDIQIWVPATMVAQIIPTGASMLGDRAWRTFRVLARLAPGIQPVVARDEVIRLASFIAKANGGRSEGMSAALLPIWQAHWGLQNSLRSPLAVLMGACGFVFLIACANMANLLLARATGRRRELALRLALGAPRRRLVRQLLTEASILAVAGSALGLVCTLWLARSLHVLLPTFATPALLDPRVDARVLVFTAVLACGASLMAGMAPALLASRERFQALSEGGRGASVGFHGARLRSSLVVAEMALAVISLVGAGLFFESFRKTRSVSPGFNADGVAMATVSLTLAGYDSSNADAFLHRASDRIRNEPGVSAVTYTDYVPLSMGQGSWEDLIVEGYAPERNENMKLYRAAIGPDYFRVLDIPLVAGRDFRFDDDSAHAPVMIVNEAFERHFLRGRSTLGVRVKGWGKWFTIVGVAKDVRNYRLTESPAPYFYVPIRQVYRPEYGYTFMVRTSAPVDQAVRTIVQAVKSADPGVSTYNALPLAEYIGAPLRTQETAARLLALLAAVALLLAAIGLYGVIADSVAQRTKEIGVRVAMGAQPFDILRAVASQAGVLLIAGLLIGLVGAAASGRIVASLLFSVSPGDPMVFTTAAAGMIVIALIATGIPARRATRVDPIIALRAD